MRLLHMLRLRYIKETGGTITAKIIEREYKWYCQLHTIHCKLWAAVDPAQAKASVLSVNLYKTPLRGRSRALILDPSEVSGKFEMTLEHLRCTLILEK